MQDKTTKSQVRSGFQYARDLMRQADLILKDSKNLTDFSEGTELGQIANELIASVGFLAQWLEEQEEARREKEAN